MSCGTLPAGTSTSGGGEGAQPLLPYKIAVFVPSIDEDESSEHEDLVFYPSPQDVQQYLIKTLQQQRLCSGVVRINTDHESIQNADLLILPAVRRIRFKREGVSIGRGAFSSLLWFATWILGLVLNDTEYSIESDYEFRLEDPYDDASVDQSIVKGDMSTERVMLAFFHRHAVASGATALTLVCPHLLVSSLLISDDPAITSRRLSEVYMRRMSETLVSYLRDDLENDERGRAGIMSLSGRLVRGLALDHIKLTGRVESRDVVSRIEVYVNGIRKRNLLLKEGDLSSKEDQRDGLMYRVEFDELLDTTELRRDEFQVRAWLGEEGERIISRTVSVGK